MFDRIFTNTGNALNAMSILPWLKGFQSLPVYRKKIFPPGNVFVLVQHTPTTTWWCSSVIFHFWGAELLYTRILKRNWSFIGCWISTFTKSEDFSIYTRSLAPSFRVKIKRTTTTWLMEILLHSWFSARWMLHYSAKIARLDMGDFLGKKMATKLPRFFSKLLA